MARQLQLATAIYLGIATTGALGTSLGGGKGSSVPTDFPYTHLWTSKNGSTYFAECTMKGFKSLVYAVGTPPLLVKSEILSPKNINFIQLPPNQVLDSHSCPAPQFVAVMKGSWYVQASSGQRRDFLQGEVMFEDDVADSPAEQSPTHISGTDDELCNQLTVQVDWKPEIDNPCPF